MPRSRRPSHIAERVAACVGIVVVPAVILWTRQTSGALLGVDSFGGAVAAMVLWHAPTVICVMLLRRRTTIVVGGLGATMVLAAVWWRSARDWHSTASFGPGSFGWLLLPLGLLTLRFAESRPRRD